MKKSIPSIYLIMMCFAVFCLFTGLECNQSEEEQSNCVELVNDSKDWRVHTFDNLTLVNHYRIQGDSAIYSFDIPSTDNVCPFEHIDVEFYFINKIPLSTFFRVKSEVLYGIFYSYILNGDNWQYVKHEDYFANTANVNFGIKPSFGDSPGWYKPYLEFWIESSGNEGTDHQNFRATVTYVKITWKHYKYD